MVGVSSEPPSSEVTRPVVFDHRRMFEEPRVQPFPMEILRSLEGVQAATVTAAVREFFSLVEPNHHQLVQRAQALWGTELKARVVHAHRVRSMAEMLRAWSAPFVVGLVSWPTGGARCGYIELDPVLARYLVHTLLGSDADIPPASPAELLEVERGVLALGMGHVLQALHAGLLIEQIHTRPSELEPLATQPEASSQAHCAMTIEVTGKDIQGRVRVWMPDGVVWPQTKTDQSKQNPSKPPPPNSQPFPIGSGLEQVSMPVSIEAGRGSLQVHQLAGLKPGDVVIPQWMGLAPDPDRSRSICFGTVRLNVRTANADHVPTWLCELAPGTAPGETEVRVAMAPQHDSNNAQRSAEQLRLAATTQGPPKTKEGHVVSSKENPDESTSPTPPGTEPVTPVVAQWLAPTEGDPVMQVQAAPLEVSIEIARFSMTVGELSALKPGQVVATGQTLGVQATLRVGDHPIAQGEIVSIDGEVGFQVHQPTP